MPVTSSLESREGVLELVVRVPLTGATHEQIQILATQLPTATTMMVDRVMSYDRVEQAAVFRYLKKTS